MKPHRQIKHIMYSDILQIQTHPIWNTTNSEITFKLLNKDFAKFFINFIQFLQKVNQ